MVSFGGRSATSRQSLATRIVTTAHGCGGTSEPTSPSRFRELMASHLTTARRVGLVLMGGVLAAFILPLLLPFPKREEGLTLCYPVVGPIQRFNADLSGAALARTRAHEDAHAA